MIVVTMLCGLVEICDNLPRRLRNDFAFLELGSKINSARSTVVHILNSPNTRPGSRPLGPTLKTRSGSEPLERVLTFSNLELGTGGYRCQ